VGRRHRIALRRTQAEEDAKRKAAPVTRAELQAAAKAKGIAANQSNDALKEALENAE
jgi:hypothetical protein